MRPRCCGSCALRGGRSVVPTRGGVKPRTTYLYSDLYLKVKLAFFSKRDPERFTLQ